MDFILCNGQTHATFDMDNLDKWQENMNIYRSDNSCRYIKNASIICQQSLDDSRHNFIKMKITPEYFLIGTRCYKKRSILRDQENKFTSVEMVSE